MECRLKCLNSRVVFEETPSFASDHSSKDIYIYTYMSLELLLLLGSCLCKPLLPPGQRWSCASALFMNNEVQVCSDI